jgi:hypothetical protein
MNDLGNLAYTIIKYEFKEDASRFPISYISGWLDAHVGELNTYIHEDFTIDDSGYFQPRELTKEESHIFATLYEIHYYEKASRESLRSSVYPTSADASSDWLMIKEGDTTIQRQSKATVSSAFAAFAREAEKKLTHLVFQHNSNQGGPSQVAGLDGEVPYGALDYSRDNNAYRRSI